VPSLPKPKHKGENPLQQSQSSIRAYVNTLLYGTDFGIPSLFYDGTLIEFMILKAQAKVTHLSKF